MGPIFIRIYTYATKALEGSRPINETKAPEWLDAKVKTKEVDISTDDRPKILKI